MTTKSDGSVLKQHRQISNHLHNDNSKKFSNFSLNQNHKCSDTVFGQTFSKTINEKDFGKQDICNFAKIHINYWVIRNSVFLCYSILLMKTKTCFCRIAAISVLLGYTVTENYQEKVKTWNKSSKNLSFKTSKNPFLNDRNKEESQKRWKNDKSVCLNKNSSTLSLHIAAYENSMEADAEKIKDLPKHGFKPMNSLSKFQEHQDSLEFPRQMEGTEPSTPEVQQFTASQKLFSPNQVKALEGIITLQIWRNGAITILTDNFGQLLSHSRSLNFDMEDEESVSALLEKAAEFYKNESREFKGVLIQLFLDEQDAKFKLIYKFCESCKEFFDEKNIFFHITTTPTLTAYTAILNSQAIVSPNERVMVVQIGEHSYQGEIWNYCLQILVRTDSNSYRFVHSSMFHDDKALTAAKESIKEKYRPKKVILIQLLPKSVTATNHREKSLASSSSSSSTSPTMPETNYFLAAKRILKCFHPICIPQSFAMLSMEAGARMLMTLVKGYDDQYTVLPHCRDRFGIVSSLKKKYLMKILMDEHLPFECSVVFDFKDSDEVLKLVALDYSNDKSYVLAKINPTDFEYQKFKATLKIDINSIYEFYVEPADDDEEVTEFLDEEYLLEENEEEYEFEVEVEEEAEEVEEEEIGDENESISTCIELEENHEDDNIDVTEEESNIDKYNNGFDNSTISWGDEDYDDNDSLFDVGSITSIESFIPSDPGDKIRVIFDKQYFWISIDESHEFEKIPIFIAFNEEKPIVGDSAKELFETQPSYVLYDLIEICSSLNEIASGNDNNDSTRQFTLKRDSDGILSFFFESINGLTKSTPDFLIAIILKHCLKLVKQKTGEKIKELCIEFNFPNPSQELKSVFLDAANLLPLKPKVVFC